MKDYNIDGKMERVFVLTQTDKRVIYIPLKDMHRVDYDRFVDLEKKDGELLKIMSRTALSNGMNALTQYEGLIQVGDIADGNKLTRMKKPEERDANPNTKHGAQDPNAMMLEILSKLTDLATKPAPVAKPAQRKAPARKVNKPKSAPVAQTEE